MDYINYQYIVNIQQWSNPSIWVECKNWIGYHAQHYWFVSIWLQCQMMVSNPSQSMILVRMIGKPRKCGNVCHPMEQVCTTLNSVQLERQRNYSTMLEFRELIQFLRRFTWNCRHYWTFSRWCHLLNFPITWM